VKEGYEIVMMGPTERQGHMAMSLEDSPMNTSQREPSITPLDDDVDTYLR